MDDRHTSFLLMRNYFVRSSLIYFCIDLTLSFSFLSLLSSFYFRYVSSMCLCLLFIHLSLFLLKVAVVKPVDWLRVYMYIFPFQFLKQLPRFSENLLKVMPIETAPNSYYFIFTTANNNGGSMNMWHRSDTRSYNYVLFIPKIFNI
jgi:hypothetical protein